MFRSIRDLPPHIRDQFPSEACEVYRATYNRLTEKATAATDDNPLAIASAAHNGAMLAVQAEFEQRADGTWHRSPIASDMDDFQAPEN